jgi:hypothetical protein
MSIWKNAQLHYMVTVAIPMTGGVDIDNDIKVYVSDDGNELVVSEKMVKMLAAIDLMHEHWMKKNPNAFPWNNPKIMDFTSTFWPSGRGRMTKCSLRQTSNFHSECRKLLSTLTSWATRPAYKCFMLNFVPWITAIIKWLPRVN